MKIGIVGWGVESQSALRWFGPEHDYLIVNEHFRDDFPPESDKIKLQYLSGDRPPGMTSTVNDLSYLDGVDKCDKVVYSVTSYWNLKRAFGSKPSFWDKTTTVLHIFFENVKTKNIIGVTGTKGKGTTATLINLMLQATLRQSSGPSAGPQTFLGGNIGTSVLDFVKDVREQDWVVLELSSFQLFYFPYSPHVSVCLKITPEHLDWHPTIEDYIEAKANIFRHQNQDDLAIYFAQNRYSQQIAGFSPGRKIPYFAPPGALIKDEGVIVVGQEEVEVIKKSEIKLIGEHNLENVCAAITAVWISLSMVEDQIKLAAIRQVLTTFSGLEHRLEFVRELGGVKYYNDSFGTTPETAVVAMRAFVEPKVLIVGGHDKGLAFDPLVDEILKSRVRQVVLIGATSHKIAEMLSSKGYKNVIIGLTNMLDIVAAARQTTQPGDVVLLTPACSSFGLFRDYKDRGEKFKSAVLGLA